MKSESVMRSCANYLHGFKDLCESKSRSTRVLGGLKVVSYLLIVPPVVSAVLYTKHKKIVDINNKIAELIDTDSLKPNAVFAKIKNKSIGQVELVDFLVDQVMRADPADPKNYARFQKGFLVLTKESQESLFRKVGAHHVLGRTLDMLPTTITNLHFCTIKQKTMPGLFECSVNSFKSDCENTKVFMKHLPKFTRLEKLSLDLRGLGLYSHEVNQCVEEMAKGQRDGFGTVFRALATECVLEGQGVLYNYYNDNNAIMNSIYQLHELIKVRPQLDYTISFGGFALGSCPNSKIPEKRDLTTVQGDEFIMRSRNSSTRMASTNYSAALCKYLHNQD